jgi:ATP-dependent DNA ligase
MNRMKINTFTYFYPEKPGLIHIEQDLFGRLSADPAWIAEPKYNGSRLGLHRLPSGIWELWNRHGEKFSFSPDPDLTAALRLFNGSLEPGKYYLFDGELRHNKTAGVRQKIVLYDCFIFASGLLTGVPFEDRRGILATLDKYGGGYEALTITEQYSRDFRGVFDELTTDPEIEGLVMKRLDGKLDLGRKRAANSRWMMKVRKPSNSYRF